MTVSFFHRPAPDAVPKPVIGVLCCNEFAERPVQAVASRFIEPLRRLSGATVLLVPALSDALDAQALGERLDGLLLTGSRSNVAASRYGGRTSDQDRLDVQRDEVALTLGAHMIERGKPVFGICRGLQELNVLFGGTLTHDLAAHHRRGPGLAFDALFDHEHDVTLAEDGILAAATGATRLRVNSVHEQGIDRLGTGLAIEAIATDDGLVEAFSASPCGAPVVAVQWHPEWNVDASAAGRAFFSLIGDALGAAPRALAAPQGDSLRIEKIPTGIGSLWIKDPRFRFALR
ncbi:gamma-glutamyl-gamma-aminobutyrate hydrolase family protein [Sphingomonas sp. JC676]|uniref:gamma-glutamyl-gamma-aminobutyrate hydrolase family protein n=1 Tax=Sphingomonas sp. JC676 TaxID=2768065 RepID=UPI00165809D2|nr:gamma-glutamyl-gamma-aminobutyrate hydrolase family protein [Sphingomonas sp. JC676]MBC9031355.1 gamma-glutamyl-gamma-aminobutyrate hydrolase family protein [Sphingomonas sp. JC676]